MKNFYKPGDWGKIIDKKCYHEFKLGERVLIYKVKDNYIYASGGSGNDYLEMRDIEPADPFLIKRSDGVYRIYGPWNTAGAKEHIGKEVFCADQYRTLLEFNRQKTLGSIVENYKFPFYCSDAYHQFITVKVSEPENIYMTADEANQLLKSKNILISHKTTNNYSIVEIGIFGHDTEIQNYLYVEIDPRTLEVSEPKEFVKE